jgi:REP element-mobilizing transposase RayT
MMNRYNRDIHHRRSIRLKDYDYSQAGGYFVTICAYDRECLFGEIVNGEMRSNEFGQIVTDEWLRSAEIRAEIELGEYVIMPNHFHAIVLITNDVPDRRGDRRVAPTVAPVGPQSKSLGALMAGYKSAVTKRINAIRQSPGASVWQRNYYEHIIRNEADYRRIAEYVAENPRRWAEDTLHPDNVRGDRPVAPTEHADRLQTDRGGG